MRTPTPPPEPSRTDQLLHRRVERMQRLLHRQGTALTTILSTIQEVVYCHWDRLADEPRRDAFLSHGIEAILGVGAATVAADPGLWRESLHPADREVATACLAEALRSPRRERFTYRLRNLATGRFHWVEETVVPEAEAPVLSPSGTLRDVTRYRTAELERAQLEDEIQRAGQEWEITFDSIDHPILLLAAGGRVRRANRSALTALGSRSLDEVLGLQVQEVGREPWTSLARLAQAARPPAEGLHSTLVDAATRRIWRASLYAARPPLSGARPWLVAALRDVTYEEQLEQSLRRAREMGAMGELVAGVAHEVRNPLFGISAVLDALEEERREDLEIVPFTDMLRQEVQRLGRLMEGLLDYGRPVPESREAGDPGPVVERALAACRPLAEARGVHVELDRPAVLPALPMDSRSLETAFKNLVENAVHHSPRGGRVRVEVASSEEGLEVRVDDSGGGFDPTVVDRALEPFFSRREGGTGLGLAIAQRVLEGHGARLHLGNRAAGGGRVTVSVPASLLASANGGRP